MMMPANFTAVNSEVVYGGADLFTILADTTAPIWNAANVKQFNTNVITLVSNSFQKIFVDSVLGTMFGGNWGGDDGKKLFGDEGTLKMALYGDNDMGFGNKVMRTLGLASVVYTLGTTSAKVDFNDKVTSFDATLK